MLDNNSIWRTIPPEEKLSALAAAQSRGMVAAVVVILVGATLAVGFHFVNLMWGAFLLSPLVFQIAAGRAWRDIRPKLMLEYLAARSAARRYAFSAASKDLDLNLMFRGTFVAARDEEVSAENALTNALSVSTENNVKASVWIALFKDAVVLMSEEPGGAKLQFSHLINDKLEVIAEGEEEDSSSAKEIVLKSRAPLWGHRTFRIQSKCPAALLVFEKVLQDRIKNYDSTKDSLLQAAGGGSKKSDADQFSFGN